MKQTMILRRSEAHAIAGICVSQIVSSNAILELSDQQLSEISYSMEGTPTLNSIRQSAKAIKRQCHDTLKLFAKHFGDTFETLSKEHI